MMRETYLLEEGMARVRGKLGQVAWPFVLLVTAIAVVGFAALYSVAGGDFDPWATRQMIRFVAAMIMLLTVAMIDIRIWMRLAYPAYAVALLLLVLVEMFGTVGMGAQRWLDLGPFVIQPSEFMKVTLVLALARYLHGLTLDEVSRPLTLVPALALIFVPTGLVFHQPDLGTGLLLTGVGGIVLFAAGLSWRIVGLAAVGAIGAAAAGWQFLKPYQKARVLTFLDPEADPMGAGYHILQSKIAIGSGGVFGKGFLEGTQSHLNFLPEKQTDFIFTTLAEQFGLVGCIALLALYLAVLGYGLYLAHQSRAHFGRILALGVLANFMLYVMINTAMVMGLIPVVGVPLPLVSYGGTSMMTVMFGFGLVMSVYVHRDVDVPRNANAFW